MKKNSTFSIIKQFKSFKYALKGLKILFSEEHNARIHLFFMFMAIGFGAFYHISAGEWMILLLLFGIVFSTELLNSAVENLCNHISPEYHIMNEKLKKAKIQC